MDKVEEVKVTWRTWRIEWVGKGWSRAFCCLDNTKPTSLDLIQCILWTLWEFLSRPVEWSDQSGDSQRTEWRWKRNERPFLRETNPIFPIKIPDRYLSSDLKYLIQRFTCIILMVNYTSSKLTTPFFTLIFLAMAKLILDNTDKAWTSFPPFFFSGKNNF